MTSPQTTPAFAPVRPRFSVDGSAAPALDQHVQSFVVEDATDGLTHCEMTFDNWGAQDGAIGYLFTDRRLVDFGKRLEVVMGTGASAGTVFDGKVSALQGRWQQERAPELLVLAEDRFQDLRMTRRTRTFTDVSDEDVMRRIASDHGLTPDLDVTGPTYAVLAQVNQSDLAFLRDRARAIDAELWMEGSTLHAKARSRRRTSELRLAAQREVRQIVPTADVAGQTTSLTVAGGDRTGKEAVRVDANDDALAGERRDGDTGATVLQQAFGDRAQRIVHPLPVRTDEARAMAEAAFRRQARRFVSGKAVATGDARIRVGASVELTGLGPTFEGWYTVTRARHVFDLASGWLTVFEVERPEVTRP
jgi:phage protein D